MITGIILFVLWCTYLGWEAARLRRWRTSIPLRISVTGTRGKSTGVRMLASVLRYHGLRALAKTTGSGALFLLPDGEREGVRRRGIPSILEQVRLLKKGAELGVDAVVAEVMSIHRENHEVESRQILRPQLVLITNFRVDHREAAGSTREEVASLHLLDIPPGATVYCHHQELLPGFREGVEREGGRVVVVKGPTAPGHLTGVKTLVRAVAKDLEIPETTVEEGILRSGADAGEFWVRSLEVGSSLGEGYLANAFAANDPESTLSLMDEARERLRPVWSGRSTRSPAPGGEGQGGEIPVIGILNLRRDRGDRTQQWVEVLEEGRMKGLSRLYLTGFHGPAVYRRLRRRGWGDRVRILREGEASDATRTILAQGKGEPPLLFGFGNLGGLGGELADLWSREGIPLPMSPLEGSHGP